VSEIDKVMKKERLVIKSTAWPIERFDKNGNQIYYENESGRKVVTEFDENNNPIHVKRGDDYEDWIEYDPQGNEARFLHRMRDKFYLNGDLLVTREKQ